MAVAQKFNATTTSITAPIGGWNARDSIAQMPPTDAVTLNNLYPTPTDIQLRLGYTKYSDGITGEVNTLMNYAGPTTETMFAAAGTKIYNTGTSTATESLTGLSSDKFQYVNMSNIGGSYLSAVNGINPGETYTDAIMRRLQPQLQNQQESFDVKMANQGIPVGSEAYNRAYRTFSQGQNDALTAAQVGGMQTGLQAAQLQNQTAANIKSLATPNYVNPYSQAATAGPDYLGAAGLSNQNALGIQNAATAGRAGNAAGLYGLGAAALTNPTVTNAIGSGLSAAYKYATS